MLAQKQKQPWIHARGQQNNDMKTHQSALRHMSDSYLVRAIARVYGMNDSTSSALTSVESKMKAFRNLEWGLER